MKWLPPMPDGYWRTWVATLCFFGAYYTLIIPMPLYLTGAGLPDWQVGVIMGAFGLASLIGRPIVGAVADSRGFRPVMIVGVVSLAIGAAGVPLTTQAATLFALRILQAAGYVAFSTAATGRISDMATAAERGSALAIFGIAANVAMTMTPATVNTLLPIISVEGALWLSALVAVVAGLLVAGVGRGSTLTRGQQSLRRLFSLPRAWWLPLAAAVIFGIGWGTFLQFLPLLAQRRSFESVGLVFTAYGVGIIFTRLITASRQDNGGYARLLTPAFVLVSAGLAAFALASGWMVMLVAALLTAAGSGMLHPSLIAIHAERAPQGARGRAVAAFYLGFDLGIGGGAWLLAPVLQLAGVGAMFVAAAAVTLSGVLLVRPILRHSALPARSA